MIREKTYKVLTTPGLSIFGVYHCKNCINLTFENTCQIWAFPEKKWGNDCSCVNFSPITDEVEQ